MGLINKLRLLHQVRKNQWLKTSELEELQAKKLRTIVKHAYDNTEFYHHKFKDAGIRPEDIKIVEDLEKVPFTTKEELREHSTGSITEIKILLKDVGAGEVKYYFAGSVWFNKKMSIINMYAKKNYLAWILIPIQGIVHIF